jgi:hypothetical protein
MDYVANNFEFDNPIENLASVIIDFFETKSGVNYSLLEKQILISSMISSLNYGVLNPNPLFISNTFNNSIQIGLQKIKEICKSGSNINNVISELEILAEDFNTQFTNSNEYQCLQGMMAIAQNSANYWKTVISNPTTTPWAPWLPPYSPNYEEAAPLWSYADAAGFTVGWLRYVDTHFGEDFDIGDCLKQAGLTAAIFSAAFLIFVIVAILI